MWLVWAGDCEWGEFSIDKIQLTQVYSFAIGARLDATERQDTGEAGQENNDKDQYFHFFLMRVPWSLCEPTF